jgi:hypothetical protein
LLDLILGVEALEEDGDGGADAKLFLLCHGCWR